MTEGALRTGEKIMQFAEEFTARRLNAYAEVERAREIELRRVIAERKALAKEGRTVTVETILRSAPSVAVGIPADDEPDRLGGSEARRELHAAVR
jgi:hypothetical protein